MILRVLLLAWLGLSAANAAPTCGDLNPVPDALQVAWVSPVARTVRAGTWLDVVRVQDLRALAQTVQRSPVRLLQGLGLVRGSGKGRAAKKDYKVTIFDVRATWLCRPIGVDTADRMISGVAVCADGQKVTPRRADSGCGYTRDTATDGRGLDVYKVRWRDASSGGFCVMPLQRFLDGA